MSKSHDKKFPGKTVSLFVPESLNPEAEKYIVLAFVRGAAIEWLHSGVELLWRWDFLW